jgi:hypothetical protein
LGLAAGGAVLTDLPLGIKLLVGLAVVGVGSLGPFGSVLLAGLLLGAGMLTFVLLLLTADAAAAGSALGVATLLIASGMIPILPSVASNSFSSLTGGAPTSDTAT